MAFLDLIFDYLYVVIGLALLLLIWVVHHFVSAVPDEFKTSPAFKAPTTGSAVTGKRTGNSPLARNR